MRNGFRAHLTVLEIVALLYVGSANGAIITFSDRTAFFEASNGALTVIDFENLDLGPLCEPVPYTLSPCVYQSQGVSFVSTQPIRNELRPLLSVDSALIPFNRVLVSNTMPLAPGEFYSEFSGGAFGFDFYPFSGSGSVVVQLENASGDTYDFPLNPNPGQICDSASCVPFFGFVTDIGRWRVSMFATPTPTGTSNFWIDNVSVTAVPEPGTLALFGLGLAGLGFTRRRKA